MYDAALGRFIGVDPEGEASESVTSYHYALNNPIMFNNPLGDKADYSDYWSNVIYLAQNSYGGSYNARQGWSLYNSNLEGFYAGAENISINGIWGLYEGWASDYLIVFFTELLVFFYKKDGIDAIRAICALSTIQGLFLGAIFFTIIKNLDLQELINKKSAGKIGIIVGILLLIFNYFRYKGKYWHFVERWKDSETAQQKKIRGLLVFFALIFSLFLIYWMGTSGYRQ